MPLHNISLPVNNEYIQKPRTQERFEKGLRSRVGETEQIFSRKLCVPFEKFPEGEVSRGMTGGFTLIEVIVTIALMSVLLGLGLILSMDVYRGTVYRSTRQVLVSSLTTARGRALSNLYQSTHGVCYLAPDFIVFRGTAYDAHSPFIEVIEGNPAVTLTSTADFFSCGVGTGIVFSQLAGSTSNMDTITIAEEGHASETVSVNSLGTIVW